MTPLVPPVARPLLLAAVAALAAAAACGGDRGHSVVCGLSQVAGPTLIQERFKNARYVLTEAPRGLPDSLPARIAQQQAGGRVKVGYSDVRGGGSLVVSYLGDGFPAASVDDTMTYAVLVVDDTSQRAMGVIVYETRRPPNDYPRVGDMEGGGRQIPLYGVRVDWGGVSNPRCPLLAFPAAAGAQDSAARR